MTRDEIIAEVYSILRLKAESMGIALFSDLINMMYIEDVEQAILNYCNIDSVPWALRYIWANMILDFVKWAKSTKQISDPDSIGADDMISTSIRVGDTTVGLASKASVLSKSADSLRKTEGVLNEIVLNYTDALNKFRRVIW
jgi:hypothetical protein